MEEREQKRPEECSQRSSSSRSRPRLLLRVTDEYLEQFRAQYLENVSIDTVVTSYLDRFAQLRSSRLDVLNKAPKAWAIDNLNTTKWNPPDSLFGYFYLYAESEWQAKNLVEELSKSERFKVCQPEGEFVVTGNHGSSTRSVKVQATQQLYLGEAGPDLSGVGAQPGAWDKGFNGQAFNCHECRLVVLDEGLRLGHADLETGISGYPLTVTLHGEPESKPGRWPHGIRTLGVIAGRGNVLIKGIAHGVEKVDFVFPYDQQGKENFLHALNDIPAILGGAQGAIVFIEHCFQMPGSTNSYPLDLHPAAHDTIKSLVDAGAVVIESLGDSHADVRTLPFDDTGSIWAGACSLPPYLDKTAETNFDTTPPDDGRVNCCHALGESVQTTAHDDPRGYEYFDGTSAAGAILAGCALCVQSSRFAARLPPLSSDEMRRWFRGGLLKCRQGDGIGFRPNLIRL